MIVMKFGGTSVENSQAIDRVAAIVKQRLPQKPVVVNYTKEYEQKTGQPVSTFGGHAYDGLMILVDAIARRLPGALAEGSGELESFSDELGGGLEYPHYTRPAEFRGWQVPGVLLSGDHAKIDSWRREQVR